MDDLKSIINKITFSISRLLAKKNNWNNNIAFSPLSIVIQLAILIKATSKNTKYQIINLTNKTFIKELKNLNLSKFENFKFSFKFYHSISLNNTFKNKSQKICNIKFSNHIFNDICQSAIQINSWINQIFQTFCGVNINCNILNPYSNILLAGICFITNISWENPPSSNSILFYVNSNKQILVNSNIHKFFGKYLFSDKFQIHFLSIPLQNPIYEAIIILPFNEDSLNQFLKYFDNQSFQILYNNITFQLIQINLPEFSCHNTFNIASILKSLNIKDIFTKNAKFSKLSNNKTYLHTILNTGILTVTKNGIGINKIKTTTPKENSIDLTYPINININQPFIFLIFENNAKFIIYSSVVTDPSKL